MLPRRDVYLISVFGIVFEWRVIPQQKRGLRTVLERLKLILTNSTLVIGQSYALTNRIDNVKGTAWPSSFSS